MMTHRQGTAGPRHPVDVLLLLTDADRLLLALRAGTGYADGQWNLPSGKLEPGEDVITAVIRETEEELGLRLDADELRMTAAVHHRNTAGTARLGLLFTAAHVPRRHGEPVNAEPHKCAGIQWFRYDQLPPNIYPYTTACITAHRQDQRLRLSGW